MKHICLLLLVYLGLCNLGTSRTIIDRDSSSFTFRYEDYLNQVRKFHPNAQSAGLLLLQAEAGLRAARGGFDPKLDASYEDKYFKSTNYWRVGEAKLKWKSPMAVQLEAGYNIADGAFLSPGIHIARPGADCPWIESAGAPGIVHGLRKNTNAKGQSLSGSAEFPAAT